MSVKTATAPFQSSSIIGQWFTSIPMTLILLVTLLATVGETLHTRVLEYGGATWPDYTHLRIYEQIQPPDCVIVDDVQGAIAQELARQKKAVAEDPLEAMLGISSPADIRAAIDTGNQLCTRERSDYQRISSSFGWEVATYANFEKAMSHLVTKVTVNRRVLLGLMILFCAAAATLRREQIALRQVQTQRDEQASILAQIGANGILTLSAFLFRQQEYLAAAEGMQLINLFMHDVFVAGFGALTLISIYQWYTPRQYEEQGTWQQALLAIPLYCFMCLSAALHFASYGFYHGIHVYMNVLLENASLFLNVSLYVWVGVLLVRTRLPQKLFDFIRVWQLPAKWLGVLMLALTAPPTAYTGASAILILAAGPALYQELRRAGQSEQLALATTALAGSMGTMLRPCLLVLLVAALNNQVTTDELYSAGVRVLFVSIACYAFYVYWLGGKSNQTMAPWSEVLPKAWRTFLPLIPYFAIFALVLTLWQFVMARPMNEFSAPVILPIIMLCVLFYERVILRETDRDTDDQAETEQRRGREMLRSIGRASDQAAPLVGALLMLIALSMSMGGMIERGGLLYLFPDTFPEPWIALVLLMSMLVLVGMFMDPFGAVILVNATLAPIAAMNGIHPIHFWIVALLAFEMGYLTPPVALNHLITRQVVGPPVEWESLHGTFWQRHFRFIFPIIVMLTALIIVTFTPLFWPHLFF